MFNPIGVGFFFFLMPMGLIAIILLLKFLLK